MRYSKTELQRAVRIEKMELVQEQLRLTRRFREISARLEELKKAEHLLEGE